LGSRLGLVAAAAAAAAAVAVAAVLLVVVAAAAALLATLGMEVVANPVHLRLLQKAASEPGGLLTGWPPALARALCVLAVQFCIFEI
jgi:hypothetical protein